jgi:hypothetical protein
LLATHAEVARIKMSQKPPIGLDYGGPEKRPGLGFRLLVLAPLLFAIIEIPWSIAVVLMAWHVLGDPEPTHEQSVMLAAIVLIPATIGAMWGASVIAWLIITRRFMVPALIIACLGLAACCAFFWLAIYGYG